MNAGSPSRGFPLLEVRGDAAARGRAHGEGFRTRIHDTYTFYMDELFAGGPLDGAAIAARAEQIEVLTRTYAPTMADEIAGIAAGSGLEPWQIFVLNARTEILNARIHECSALYFASSGVLAQNWDWVEALEDLCVVIRHEHNDGFRHLTFAEPGMVAKIGMNSAGLGVCLNILFAAHDLTGLPVHILIGALLNARDFTSARTLLDSCGLGKASHLLIADGNGHAVSMEYFGDEAHALGAVDGVLLHTNHCLGRGAAGRTPDLENSCARYDRLQVLVAANPARDVAAAKRILLDSSGGENALMRGYREQSVLGNQRVGTCASIVMELGAATMHIRRGPGSADNYTAVAV